MIIKKTESTNCFDFLRILFCSSIVLSHLAGLSQSKSLEFFYYANTIPGVKGFFVISGFLVAKSYINSPSLKNYFIKRAKRILPAYFFIVILAAIILSVFSRLPFIEYFSNIGVLKYIGWNILFMNFVHPCLPGLFEDNLLCAVNGSLWTLKVEEGFYFVLPIIFYLINKTKKPLLLLVTIYIFSIGYWSLMDSYFHKPLLAKQLPGYLTYFSVGIYLFLNLNHVLKNKNIYFISALIGLILNHIINLKIDVIFPVAYGIIVILAAYSLPFLNNFGKYGDFTYGIYIIHFPLIQVFRQYNLFEKYNPYIMSFCIISMTLLFAIFSWFVIEKRFLDRYKKPAISSIK